MNPLSENGGNSEMNQEEGIPLWEFIRPKAENRVSEISALLLFYADYEDQINPKEEAFDLFLTELLYAGFDCLIAERLLDGETLLKEFKIPAQSLLYQLTKFLEQLHFEPQNRLATLEKIFKAFPIVLHTRIGRDLFFQRNWAARREAELKTDPQKFAIEPLSQKDFVHDRKEHDLPDSIKKGIRRFEYQFSKEYPHLTTYKIIKGVVQVAVIDSRKLARYVNKLDKVSQLAEGLSGLTKVKLAIKRKTGQQKGAIREGYYYDYKKGRQEYENLLKLVKEVKKKSKEMIKRGQAVSKEELLSLFKEKLSEDELSLIKFDQPPAKSAFTIWHHRNPFVGESLRTFRRRFPKIK
jgi:hypothetical protein